MYYNFIDGTFLFWTAIWKRYTHNGKRQTRHAFRVDRDTAPVDAALAIWSNGDWHEMKESTPGDIETWFRTNPPIRQVWPPIDNHDELDGKMYKIEASRQEMIENPNLPCKVRFFTPDRRQTDPGAYTTIINEVVNTGRYRVDEVTKDGNTTYFLYKLPGGAFIEEMPTQTDTLASIALLEKLSVV